MTFNKLVSKELPEPFGYYCFFLNSDHLHFGLWQDDMPLGVSLEDAQDNMFLFLSSFLPPPPATVLDVGCGLGYSAALLSEKGYEVFAIAPSSELIKYANEKYAGYGVTFREISFFDDDKEILLDEKYDVIFFQESLQYLSPLEGVFKKSRSLLKDEGLIIIGDEVCYDKGIKKYTSVHLSNDILLSLYSNGFMISRHIKIGGKVHHTCEIVIKRFSENFDKMVTYFGSQSKERINFYLEGWKKQKEWYQKGQFGYEIFVAKKDRFFVRDYIKGDEETILDMFNHIFKQNRSLEHWIWKFRNPYGAHKIAITYSNDLNIAAHYAGYVVPFYDSIKKYSFYSFQIGDTMTHPSVRNVGLGKTNILARTAYYYYARFCDGVVPFIYGFNTGHIKKLGMRYLGYEYIKPVCFRVKRIEGKKSRLNRVKQLLCGITVKEIKSVDVEFDDFFNRVKDFYGLLVKRDAQYIKWRYLDCPDRIYKLFVIRKWGKIIGWGAFTFKDDRIIWGDALFDLQYDYTLDVFLEHIVCSPEYANAKSIEGWFTAHPEKWSYFLECAGFKIEQEPDQLTPGFVIFSKGIDIDYLDRNFYYTKGDSDLF